MRLQVVSPCRLSRQTVVLQGSRDSGGIKEDKGMCVSGGFNYASFSFSLAADAATTASRRRDKAEGKVRGGKGEKGERKGGRGAMASGAELTRPGPRPGEEGERSNVNVAALYSY